VSLTFLHMVYCRYGEEVNRALIYSVKSAEFKYWLRDSRDKVRPSSISKFLARVMNVKLITSSLSITSLLD
jgi:hypothetical protein